MFANPKNMFMLSVLAFYTSLALLPAGAGAQIPIERPFAAASQAPDLNFPKAPSPLPAVPRMGLFKPNGVGPFPALVLHHQCGGLSRGEWQNKSMLEWARQAVNRGYVVLLLDSLSARGVDTVCMGPKNGVNFARRARCAAGGDTCGRLHRCKRVAHVGFPARWSPACQQQMVLISIERWRRLLRARVLLSWLLGRHSRIGTIV